MQHASLENGRWAQMSLAQQMANIGSETSRIYNALLSGKLSRAESSFARFQELIDLTIRDGRKDEQLESRSAMWEELCRFREVYCLAYLERNMSELAALNRYLDQFAGIERRPHQTTGAAAKLIGSAVPKGEEINLEDERLRYLLSK